MAHHVTRPQHRRGALVRRFAGGLTTVAIVVLTAAPVQASPSGGRRIKDADSNRTVYLVCLALVLLAAALAVFTWWFWRNTRRDPEALGPLEVMGERQFVDGDVTSRQTLLDANRPVGAVPLVAGVPEPLMVEPDAAESPAAGSSAAGSSAAGSSAAGLSAAGSPDDAAASDSSDAEPDPDLGEQTKLLEIPAQPVENPPAPVAAAGSGPAGPGPAEPAVSGRGSLIDPGLPQEEPAEADGEQLTLAELASMDVGFRPFDPDELTSTPSTGIPVIESPEAWVEREVSAVRSNGTAEIAVTLPPVVDPPSEPDSPPDAGSSPEAAEAAPEVGAMDAEADSPLEADSPQAAEAAPADGEVALGAGAAPADVVDADAAEADADAVDGSGAVDADAADASPADGPAAVAEQE